jgi:2-methylcitrate dehydratase PrpD
MAEDRRTSLTRGLAHLMHRPITAADRARAALHVLDWIGCAAAGARTPPGLAMIAYGHTMPPGSGRAFGGLSLASRDAALVNGAFGNVLEMDDFYRTALVHPGPVVIPAALAAAESTNASAQALLDAVVRGFEAMIRIGRSVGAAHYRQFHNTATCGVFGSAVAAGSLLGLDDDRLVHALGNAGTQASGLWQCRIEETMSKQLHNGRAAQSGLIAAELATHGFTGARFVLEGPLGFFAGLCPDAEPWRVLDDPDAPWLIHGTSFKPWPACRHTHPTIDAIVALRQHVKPEAIRRIVVETYRDAIAVCDNPDPRTPVEAKFSLQHASAVVLLRGKPRLEDFDMDGVRDPAVAALRHKVVLLEGRTYTAAYPAHFGAMVRIECSDGGNIQHAIPDAYGDPENPMPDAAIRDKARMLLASAGYASAAADTVIAAALTLAEGAPVTALTRLLH